MKLPKHRRDEAALNSRLIRRPIKRMVWLFLLPTFAAFCIGFLYPFFKGLFLSFCNFRITSQWTWTGLENYRKAFQDPGYMHAFWYTALFALVSLIVINLFAFTIAYALTQKFKGTNVFRTVFFMPNLIGGIVLGYIWSMIFDGILIKYNTSVILETKYGFWGLVILVCWQQIGYMMIIYIAGLQAVPEDMLEAARIDGANRWQQVWHVTIPGLQAVIAINLITTVGAILAANSELILLLYTPATYDVADVIGTYTYRLGILEGQYSYTTAAGLFTAVIGFAFTYAANKISNKLTGFGLW
mgnify:CR=1 FL=1